jgi:hemerythrin superfamily protein
MDLDTALTGKPAEGATATDMLRADHREVRRLFGDYDRAGEDAHARRVALRTLCLQLELHDRIERDVFYPAIAKTNPERANSALAQHDDLLQLVRDITTTMPDAACRAKVKELEQRFEEHVRKEEGFLFQRLESTGEAALRELGAELIKRKEALTRSTEEFEGPAT